MADSRYQRLLVKLLLCTLLLIGTLQASESPLLARSRQLGVDVDAPPLLRQRHHVQAAHSRRHLAMMTQPEVQSGSDHLEQRQEQPPAVPAAPAIPPPPPPLPAPVPVSSLEPVMPWPTGSPDAGKTWTLSPNFNSFADFRILKWSSGSSNARILASGLPPYAFAPPITVPGEPHATTDGNDAEGEDGGEADGQDGMDGGDADGGDADGADAYGEDGKDSEVNTEEEEDENEENEKDVEESEEEEDSDNRKLHAVPSGSAAGVVGSAVVHSTPASRPVRQAVALSLAARQEVAQLKPQELISSVVKAAIAQANLEAGQAVIQTYYPQGSSNPGGETVGGAQFYSLTPLNLESALTVALEYSVFFPVSFDWVKGGKLPGLYGGRESCSGGDTAADCWSARFMWRENGMGELYLYVPQNKQDPSICSVPPMSICNGNYGVSMGRGSFTFKRGAWTTVKQTISLGSGKVTDGSVVVEADGKTVLSFNKVFFPSAHKGLFFSTFFGGNGDDWATPRDQAIFFKGFSISVLR